MGKRIETERSDLDDRGLIQANNCADGLSHRVTDWNGKGSVEKGSAEINLQPERDANPQWIVVDTFRCN
jgi:hypothetical protein